MQPETEFKEFKFGAQLKPVFPYILGIVSAYYTALNQVQLYCACCGSQALDIERMVIIFFPACFSPLDASNELAMYFQEVERIQGKKRKNTCLGLFYYIIKYFHKKYNFYSFSNWNTSNSRVFFKYCIF